MIYFLSNHSDTSFLRRFFPIEEIILIPHPLLKPEWDADQIKLQCASEIGKAVQVDTLIMNGDYTLVGLILLERAKLGKRTGFIAFRRIGGGAGVYKGKISHQAVLEPVGIRWL